MSRTRLALLVLAACLLTAGTALAADQVRLRDRARDQSCQETLVADVECLTAGVHAQTREQAGESDESSAAVRVRTRMQTRAQTDGICEPVCDGGECLETQVRTQVRDRTGENSEAPTATRERIEARECSEACLGDQGPGPSEMQSGEPVQTRAGEPGGAGPGGGK